MGMTGSGLWAARKAAMDAVVAPSSSNPDDAISYRDALGLADSTAIVEYIQANAVVQTTSGAPDSEHTGHVL